MTEAIAPALAQEVAALRASVEMLVRMEKDGRLPPREGRYWDRKELDKWQRDRA